MAEFVVSHESTHSPQQAWRRLTDWPAHARYVALTTITVSGGENQVGTVFTAHTGIGRVGFDDPMEITDWQPPDASGTGRCRLDKRGRVVLGWAELTVEPSELGSRATWREDARVARMPQLADGVTARAARVLFARVLRRLIED